MSQSADATPGRRAVTAPSLPRRLDAYTDLALRGLVVGTVLCLVAFVTNPVPDPSFPWATLPAGLRLPVTQPRIEHWPVSYTLGIWLWILGFPALFLAGYRWYGSPTPRSTAGWLVGLPAGAMLSWSSYCRWFWPKLHPATWNAPSYTVVCWLYCSTYDPVWSNLALGIAGFGLVVAGAAAIRRSGLSTAGLVAFGVLAFPLGLPALYAAYRRIE